MATCAIFVVLQATCCLSWPGSQTAWHKFARITALLVSANAASSSCLQVASLKVSLRLKLNSPSWPAGPAGGMPSERGLSRIYLCVQLG